MAIELSPVNQPPAITPPSGYEMLLPDEYYFFDTADISIDHALHVTARTVAAWGDHYRGKIGAALLDEPFPASQGGRASTVDRLFERHGVAGSQPYTSLIISDGALVLLDASDGLRHGYLCLTADQFDNLRKALMAAGLPEDLYYRAGQVTEIVEPVSIYGGVAVMPQLYSPARWKHRNVLEVSPPSESERAQRFREALASSWMAVSLRIAEITEPGKAPDPLLPQLAQLRSLLQKTLGEHNRSWPPSERA